MNGSLRFSFHFSEVLPESVVQPPEGLGVFRAKKWGDPILVRDALLSTEIVNTSNFQVIPVWVEETQTFSAVSGNVSQYDRSKGDMDNLLKIQPSTGATWSDIFNVLVGKDAGRTWWSDSDPATAPIWYAGTQLWGGQCFAATLQTFPMLLKYPNGSWASVNCRKILPFRRADFAKDPEKHPWLFNWFTVAYRNNLYSEYFGLLRRRVPVQVLDPRDFRFNGPADKQPSAFYIPAHWVESVA